ncbi:MAG: hypothetical protein QXF25_02035, partial [Candidatus Pacearchaeota archaeon]
TYYDISVKLNGISTISGNLSANLTIKKIHEQITAPTAQAISPPSPTATPTEKGTPMTTTEKKSKFFLVFLIILAIVIVLGIGGFIVWKEFIEKKPEVSEETQTVTPPSPIIQPQRISQPVIPSVSPIPPRQPILQILQTPQKTPSPVSMPAPSLQQLEKTQPKPTTEPLPKQTEEETIALLKKIAFEKNQTPQTSTLSEKNSKPEEKPNEKKERREA